MASRGALAPVLLVLLLAGCASPSPGDDARDAPPFLGEPPRDVQAGLARMAETRAAPLVLERPFTVHVVAVGWDLGLLDQEAVRAALPRDTSPRVGFSPPMPDGLRSGLSHRLSYAFHQAPDAFADALFGAYPAISEEVPIPGGRNGFLGRYDAAYGLGRAGSGTMRLVDAQAAEARIEALRGEHGLRFEGPHATVFLLDSWTRVGLWKDQYYWYGFHGDLRAGPSTRDMRAWGGTQDFLFLDRGAAPNQAPTDRSGFTDVFFLLGSMPVFAPEGTAYNDPPAWHYEGDAATVGHGAARRRITLTEAVVSNLDPAVNVRILNDYAFPPSYADRYHVNVHLWHDGRSLVPTDDLGSLVDQDLLRRSMQEAVPWADVQVTVTTYVAPRDDPGMHEAMQRAKAEGAQAQLAMPVLFNHVEAHADRYKRNEKDALDVMALGFILEGHYAVVVPFAPGGAAVMGPDNLCWGATASVNDAFYLREGQDADAVRAILTQTYAHELGHFFGLPHAHDGTRRTPDGYETALDHTWSSTNTTMSYRVNTAGVDHFHRASLARAHAHDNLARTLRDLDWTYRALDAAGHGEAPVPVRTAILRAAGHADAAWRLYHEGRDEAAAHEAVAARRAAEDAMRAAGVREREEVAQAWDATGVHSAGRKHSAFVLRPGAALPAIRQDLRPVALGDDAERVTVRATWTNAPASWGDFFLAWRAPGILGPILVDPAPAAAVVSLGEGIHDEADEGPTDGAVTRQFTLDLDYFPALRGEGVLFEAGAGTQGTAVNGAYRVEILVERRTV